MFRNVTIRNRRRSVAAPFVPALLLMIFILLPGHAQTTWVPSNQGLEGGSVVNGFVFDTTGVPVAAIGDALYRYLPAQGRWMKIWPNQSINRLWRTPGGALMVGSEYNGHREPGFYRSANGVDGWTKVRDTIVSALFATADGEIIGRSGARELLRSTDDGITWSAFGGPLPYDASDLYKAPDGTWYCQTLAAVYRSDDGLETWTQIGSHIYSHAHLWLPDGRLVIATNYDLRITPAPLKEWDGKGWDTLCTLDLVRDLTVHPGGAWLAYRDGHSLKTSDSNGLYRSTDQGATWKKMVGGLLSAHSIGPDGTIWINQGYDVSSSTDEGATWTVRNEGLDNIIIQWITADNQGRLYAISRSGGYARDDNYPQLYSRLHRSDDGGRSWQKIRDSITAGEAPVRINTPIWIDNASNVYVYDYRLELRNNRSTYRYWVTRSTDQGRSWTAANGDSSITEFALNATSGVMAAISSKGDTLKQLLVSNTNGATWQAARYIKDMAVPKITSFGYFFVFIRTGLSSAILYRSTDYGETWSKGTEPILEPISELPDGTLFSYKELFNVNTNTPLPLFRSLNGGITWELLYKPGELGRIVPGPQGYLYGEGPYGGLSKRSTDNGGTWTPMTQGLANARVTGLLFPRPGLMYGLSKTGSAIRPYLSTDAGLSWQLADDGLPPRDVVTITMLPNGRLLAGTLLNGIYSITTPQGVNDTDDDSRPVAALHQPVPNPASGTVRLSFTLPRPSAATLRIYDLLGREMACPLDAEVLSGGTGIDVDLSPIPPGTYIVALRAGDITCTRYLLRQ